MKRAFTSILILSLMGSCIPLRVAPSIQDYKVTEGKRFKRSLPEKTVFVFEDPKEANHFYDYVNTKFALEGYYVDVEVPFFVNERVFYFSFYEVEIKDKTLNLAPIIFDTALNVALGNEDFETYSATDENSISRKGNYYIAMEVFSSSEDDCLKKGYVHRTAVLEYLRSLKKEYLSTHNYNEVVFKNQ